MFLFTCEFARWFHHKHTKQLCVPILLRIVYLFGWILFFETMNTLPIHTKQNTTPVGLFYFTRVVWNIKLPPRRPEVCFSWFFYELCFFISSSTYLIVSKYRCIIAVHDLFFEFWWTDNWNCRKKLKNWKTYKNEHDEKIDKLLVQHAKLIIYEINF